MEIIYRETREEDFENLSKLFKEIFGKEFPPSYFKWKYKNGYSLIALSNDEIVGHYGGIFFYFHYKGKVYKVVQATDLMTHPKVRHLIGRKSVILNLANLFFDHCLKEKIYFAYGFPGEKSRLLGEKFLDYRPLCKVRFNLFELKKGEFIYPIEKFNFLNYDIKRITYFGKSYGIYKNLEYFKWRYIENPVNDYYISYNKNTLFVFKISEREAILMDYICWNKKEAIELFNGAKASLKNFGIDILKTFSLNFIEKGEFKEVEENYFLEYKPLIINPKKILNFNQFSPSDYDVF